MYIYLLQFFYSTTVVLRTIRQLTKIDSEKRVPLKRKFQDSGEPGWRDRWWRSCSWRARKLCITSRGLEARPSDDDSEMDSGAGVDECEKCSEPKSNGTMRWSNLGDGHPPPNANSPGVSRASCSNQPSDMQTGTVDEIALTPVSMTYMHMAAITILTQLHLQ